MTTATENPLFAGLSEKEVTRVEWSRLAAKRAREYHHGWESLARILTRNPSLKLEFTGGTPRTDGSTIWLRVPIELGDPTPHVRNGVCGKRDENGIQRCPACKTLEGVETTMYHEIFHITHDSFAKMSDREQIDVLKDAFRLEANGTPEGSRMRKLSKQIQTVRPDNFVVASKVISKWFGLILNACEDGRVNTTGMNARPGVRNMFKAQTYDIFVNGIKRNDGTISKWSEAPANMQAIIMLYCKIFSLDYTGWFDDRIIQDLDDYQINKYCERMGTCRDVAEVYRFCIPVLERLRELGYCKAPEDPEDEPQPESKDGEKSEDEGQQGDPVEADGAGSGGESQPQDDESEDDQSGGSPDTSDESEGPQNPGKDDESEEEESSTGDDGEPGDEDVDGEEGDGPGDEESSEESDQDGSGSGDEESDDAEAGDGEEESDSGAGDTEQEEQEAPEGESGDPVDDDFRGEGPESYEDLEYGEPDECEDGFDQFGRHDKNGEVQTNDSYQDRQEVERAIAQEEHFDAPSQNVWGVNIHEDGVDGMAWMERYHGRNTDPIEIPASIIQPALARLRVVFADNKKGEHQRNLERGSKIDGRFLGQRVPTGDYRIFTNKILPGKKDWFVLIGLDVSGSTGGSKLALIKKSSFAMAELCSLLGVKFAVYAHTGAASDHAGMDLDMYVIKSPDQRWDPAAKRRLETLQASSANLDGHTLEFYRKVIERQRATDKIVMYYTDGAMPLANYDEELIILKREIENLRRMRTHLVGVGIKTDSPTEHGLDTIQMDHIEDVPKVVNELHRRLMQ